jgi:murein DD-endopeptidase MepM/ murein hydrolase activator NlpD
MAYTIKSGDTLSQIAAANKTTVAALQAANPSIKDPNKIYAGASLNIPTAAPTTVPTIQTTQVQRATDAEAINKYNSITAPNPINVQQSELDAYAARYKAANPTATNPAVPPTGKQVTVVSYVDNPDGTTTNTLSDGTTSTVRYTKNADGTLTPTEVTPAAQTPVQQAEKEFADKTKARIAEIDQEKADFDSKLQALKSQRDTQFNDYVDSIKAISDQSRQTLLNSYQTIQASRAKAGYMTNSFRYTPMQAEGLVSNDEINYIKDLNNINVKEKTLILDASVAKEKEDWDMLKSQMDQYSKIQSEKKELLKSLLTAAQDTNKRIENEAKIAREAFKVQSGSDAVTRAKGVAASLAEAIKGLPNDKAEEFILGKATELSIDKDILRSAVLEQGVKNLKDMKSLTVNPPKETISEKDAAAFGDINAIIASGEKIDETPIVDPSGFFTAIGFKTIADSALESGIKREKLLQNYGTMLNPQNMSIYKLTPTEKKKLGL